MVTDQQVRRLFNLMQKEMDFGTAAAKAGMDEKTARKYRRKGKLPSELKKDHAWQTRPDSFEAVWPGIKANLELNPGLEAKTLFEDLQRRYPGQFADGQLRTLQRRIKVWRATEGPPAMIIFPQMHYPGELSQSDFTHMDKLDITIGGRRFEHLLYHFVLTYSNWETGIICFSESFESLSEGLQSALWKLGGVPRRHRTDCLTTAVQKAGHPDIFTGSYLGLLDHYGLCGEKTNRDSPHENGDVEQRHHRFKKALNQALLMRGHRDFANRGDYELFLHKLFKQLNAGRKERFLEEQVCLRRLPERRLETAKKLKLRVGPSSTIRIHNNVYSVHSRLKGEQVEVRLYMDQLELWYGQKKVDTLPRLRGEGKAKINYVHIIDSLMRKPGAFENYRYRDELFPSVRFRIAYDDFKKRHSATVAARHYLAILYLAAREGESRIDGVLRDLIDNGEEISEENVRCQVKDGEYGNPLTEIHIPEVNLHCYDVLLEEVTP